MSPSMVRSMSMTRRSSQPSAIIKPHKSQRSNQYSSPKNSTSMAPRRTYPSMARKNSNNAYEMAPAMSAASSINTVTGVNETKSNSRCASPTQPIPEEPPLQPRIKMSGICYIFFLILCVTTFTYP